MSADTTEDDANHVLTWRDRMVEGAPALLLGLGLVALAALVLWFGEARTVKNDRSLDEAARMIVNVDADRPLTDYNHQFVRMTGLATPGQFITDDDFNLSAPAVKLRRHVEMYQWRQVTVQDQRSTDADDAATLARDAYVQQWSAALIKSSHFSDAEHHANPRRMPFDDAEFVADKVVLRGTVVSEALVDQIAGYEPYALSDSAVASLPQDLRDGLHLVDGALVQSADPAHPQVGDVRVTFEVVPPQEVTVVAQLVDGRLQPYEAEAGGDVALLAPGAPSAESMIDGARAAADHPSWPLRGIGFALMFTGALLVFKPMAGGGGHGDEAASIRMPMIGDVLHMGVGLVAAVASMAMSLLTIAARWLTYRPIFGLATFALAAAVLWWLKTWAKLRSTRRRPAPAA